MRGRKLHDVPSDCVSRLQFALTASQSGRLCDDSEGCTALGKQIGWGAHGIKMRLGRRVTFRIAASGGYGMKGVPDEFCVFPVEVFGVVLGI